MQAFKVFVPWILFLIAASGCQNIQSVVKDLQGQEADCKKAGGVFVLDKGCVMPETPQPAPIPEPVDPPTPTPLPAPTPTPSPSPDNAITYYPGEYYTFPPINSPVESLDISFSLKGLNGATFPTRDGWLFAIMGQASGGHEYNLQFHVFRDGQQSWIRLITQNFTPGCNGPKHCDVNDGAVMSLNPAAQYDFHIYGPVPHTSRGYLVWRMDCTESGKHVMTWEVPAYGPFKIIKWIRLGNGEIFPGRPGQDAPLTIINRRMEWK